MVKYLVLTITVSVQKEHFGMEIGVSLMDALEGNDGMDQPVHVNQANISMALCVLFVLMDKNGMNKINHVYVLLDINGMVTIVKEDHFVQGTEFGMPMHSNVYAHSNNIGMVYNVGFDNNAAVEKFGMTQALNAIALHLLIGMKKIAFFVLMERFGIKKQSNVFVEMAQDGTVTFVLLSKNVMEV